MSDTATGDDRTWVSLALVRTLVHAARGRIDLLAEPADLDRWLRSHDLPSDGVRTETELAEVHGLRDAMRSVLDSILLGAPANDEAVSRVNAAAAESGHPELSVDGSTRWVPSVDRPTAEAALARDFIALISEGPIDRLRECAADDCDRLFIQDHGRRIWCSPACGTRTRVRRFDARRSRPEDA